jgi:hypothetical protein
MTALQLKSELHQIIDSIDDVGLLKAIKLVLKQKPSSTGDFWDMLPDDVKASINKGIAQADNGDLISHENMVAETKSKYNLK